MQSLLDFELVVEHDYSKADRKHIVARMITQKVSIDQFAGRALG